MRAGLSTLHRMTVHFSKPREKCGSRRALFVKVERGLSVEIRAVL
jgi:hypothetical protein